MEPPDLADPLSEDIISRFESESGLGLHNEIFAADDNLFINNDTEEESETDDIIILHMDIREPLSGLRALLEHKIGVDLNGYSFWLQDAQMLEPHKNLVDQCVKGEGLVQINVQIQTNTQRINIVDVLKPTEAALEYSAALGEAENNKDQESIKIHDETEESQDSESIEGNTNSNAASSSTTEDESKGPKDVSPVVNWILDPKFKKEQLRLKFPDNPTEWSIPQVKHWLHWSVRQFNLTQIKLSDWNMDGKQLAKLNLEDFKDKVPNDPGNVFWTHLELLRKCKFVAIIQKNVPDMSQLENIDITDDSSIMKKAPKIIKKPVTLIKQFSMGSSPVSMGYQEPFNNRSGNNGQIQLWQFLLDILTDKEHTSIIQWLGGDGEFKLTDPEQVAQLWGERKNKPAMNYEKLSRALRYYYDGDMISKVHGKRFVYKFVCDLKQLVGYNAQELSNLINSCTNNNSTLDYT